MPRRRPPGEGHVVNNIFLLAAAVLFLPWLVSAQQQQRPGSGVRQRQESPHESLEANPLHTAEATKRSSLIETPLIVQRRKNTISVNNRDIQNDASAIATLAPAGSAVAAPSVKRPNTSSVGLSPPHDARNLKDWDVEDFVLLATVDGTLHARERKKGVKKWDLKLGGLEPMVQTTYYRRNRSSVEEDFETIPIDNYLWAIEPSRDGSIYIYQPGGPSPGLVNTGLTMKKLVEVMSPHWTEDPPVMYTGEKKTTMMTVDAETGIVIGHFSPTGAYVNQEAGKGNCKNTGFPSDECNSNQVLTIGRTEYTVGIQGAKDGHQIATLRFFEWTPNSFDHDLSRQYHQTKDQKYVYAQHDGLVIGFHHETPNETPRPLFREKFDSPVVRVFDVGRHYTLENSNPPLMILPQPLPPDMDQKTAEERAGSIFLNHTEDGSWYAMSGKSYPLVDLQKPRQAQCMNQEYRRHRHTWDIMNNARLSEALVGLHSIEGQTTQEQLLTISPPSAIDTPVDANLQDHTIQLARPPSVMQKLQSFPNRLLQYVLDFITNPIWMAIAFILIITYKAQIKQYVQLNAGRLLEEKQIPSFLKDTAEQIAETVPVAKVDSVDVPTVEVVVDDIKPDKQDAQAPAPQVNIEKDIVALVAPPSTDELLPASPEKKKEKKAHRGRRGGVKHRKGNKNPSPEASQILEVSQDDTARKPEPTVDDAVRKAQTMGQQTKLEPDIHTVPNDPSEVSGPILRIGALECDTEQRIGNGSNGTLVFRGKFDGRDVAVKRMLIQFFDIASQETKLLRESDDHPNVIRYYAQEQAGDFLYIALELCPASLADVIEKPNLHRDLAQGGERDLPGVLYQITNGLQHLHKLRIVHRDLKPQNILVAMDKMDKNGAPRLLVSDFGLCKKLDGEQSSFRATTAHAAGTSGWRAPELLQDDDAKEGLSMVDASTDGNSGPLLSSELMSNRRATRAIDIFSLGLVFFYVLTKGSHPFDCGDKYMREVNIRKDKFDLNRLSVYGDYGMEADNLIRAMLNKIPQARPSAREVMAHPFFWSPKKRLNFLCDVSDHFEKEKRDPPTAALVELESYAAETTNGDFLKSLGREFVDSMGKQRKYTGSRLLDLLRALRNKKNHYEDMSDKLKKEVGPLPEGYLNYWTTKFPNLLLNCWSLVHYLKWDDTDRFREYYTPARH